MKYVSSFALTVVIALTAMFAFPPTPAKAVVPVFDMGMLTNTVSQDHNVKSVQRRAEAPMLRFLTAPTAAAPVLSASVLSYNPSVELRRANFAAFVERTRRVDPQAAADLAANVKPEIIPQMHETLKQYGASAYNLADAYAVWWITAWGVVNFDPTAEATAAQILAVSRQSANAMLAIPEFGNLSNAQKQELAEAYLLYTSINLTYLDYVKANPSKQSEVADAIKQGALKSGMDLDQMVLTESGFEPR
ncbi:DUF6683 family protein [Qipengyuania qiaonensis]|uniref:DUF885 family protein n=1 Tax=Qipengyuania qiaonensis TaxID=2867240 RepID=A0ABS7J8V2_9SPHN|nr:DUF6683 family protein [Qipengyuania qiaonensis]MBX7482746.1 hypothetical protein [Qipengyuania qiaonensis]